MKYSFFSLILTAVLIAGTGCEQVKTDPKTQAKTKSAPDNEPPLLLDDEPLLLLDDEPANGQETATGADNSRCFVCHLNYAQEEIAVTHARVNIGCAGCHGESDEHIADESWASGGNGTAPDIMYPKPKINPACMRCHPRDKIDTEQHKPLFSSDDNTYCTDCHGNHRLKIRKCKWK